MDGTASIGHLGHIAIATPDLDRFRRFYEDVLGIPLTVVLRMGSAPHFRHALFQVAPGLALHAVEVPGYDPRAQGIGTDAGERGRIDHFAFVVADRSALEQVAARLRAAGASDGQINGLGPLLSLYATDPDGLAFEVTCPDPDYDPAADRTEIVEHEHRARWWTGLAPPVLPTPI